MVEEEILFIFGAPRSGTKYVNSLLRTYFNYGLCAEGQFVPRIGKRLGKYGNLKVDKNLQRLIDDILKERMIKHFRTVYSERVGRPVDVTSADVWKNLPERTYPGVVYSVFLTVAEQLQKKRVATKFPDYSKHLHQLLNWFPKAKFLHVVRDGRDVALSVLNLTDSWGQKSVFACAQKWVQVHEAARRFCEDVSPDQYCEVHYEQLLAAPKPTVLKLEEFLDISLDPDTKEAIIKSITENDKRWNFGKWREKMSPCQLRIYEAIGGEWLRQHGYECVYDKPTVSWCERAVYTSQELSRRVKQSLGLGAILAAKTSNDVRNVSHADRYA